MLSPTAWQFFRVSPFFESDPNLAEPAAICDQSLGTAGAQVTYLVVFEVFVQALLSFHPFFDLVHGNGQPLVCPRCLVGLRLFDQLPDRHFWIAVFLAFRAAAGGSGTTAARRNCYARLQAKQDGCRSSLDPCRAPGHADHGISRAWANPGQINSGVSVSHLFLGKWALHLVGSLGSLPWLRGRWTPALSAMCTWCCLCPCNASRSLARASTCFCCAVRLLIIGPVEHQSWFLVLRPFVFHFSLALLSRLLGRKKQFCAHALRRLYTYALIPTAAFCLGAPTHSGAWTGVDIGQRIARVGGMIRFSGIPMNRRLHRRGQTRHPWVRRCFQTRLCKAVLNARTEYRGRSVGQRCGATPKSHQHLKTISASQKISGQERASS